MKDLQKVEEIGSQIVYEIDDIKNKWNFMKVQGYLIPSVIQLYYVFTYHVLNDLDGSKKITEL